MYLLGAQDRYTEVVHLLIVGGAGFIGSNFLRQVISGKSNFYSKVKVLDSLSYSGNLANFRGIPAGRFEFIQGDICDRTSVARAMQSVDVLINFAAETHVDNSIREPDKFVHTNVLGLQVLLDSAVRNRVKKFIQVSTDEVYGSIPSGSCDEQSLLRPNSPYSASKAAGDHLVRAYFETYGLQTITTRCCNNYGPNQHIEKFIPLLITNCLSGRDLPIYGDGTNIREWIYVKDHCIALQRVIEDGKPGSIYNIGSGFELDNLRVAHEILNLISFSPSKFSFVSDRPGHDFRYSLNSKKISVELGFAVERDFYTGLRETIEWYANNVDWWTSRN